MLEYDKVYNCGKRSFIYHLFRHGWLFFLIAGGFFYLTFEMYFGRLNAWTVAFLASHEDWYVSLSMLTEWIVLLALSIILVGYIRSKVLHRKIKFKIDKHAFHLREGLFMIKETTIPYKQISNVHLVRPYLFRLIGLARLDIMTVSDKDVLRRSSGSKLNEYLIPLIDTKLAKELAQHLMKHTTGDQHLNTVHTEDTGNDGDYKTSDDSNDPDIEDEDLDNESSDSGTSTSTGTYQAMRTK